MKSEKRLTYGGWLVGLATLLINLPSLAVGFLSDDYWFLQAKPLSAVAHFFDAFSPDHFYYRPLGWVTYYLDRLLFGVEPVWWHLHTILWSVAANLLVYVCLRRLVDTHLALVAAIFFALWPTHPGASYWVVARYDPMAAAFFFGSIYAYLRWREQPADVVDGGKDGRGRFGWLLLALVGYVAALLSKEVAVTLPLVLLLIELFFYRTGWRAMMRLLPFFGVLAAYGAMRLLATFVYNVPVGFGRAATISYLERVLRNLGTLTWIGSGVPYYEPDRNGLGVGATLVVLGLLLLVGGLLTRWRGRLTAFSLLCFVVTLIPSLPNFIGPDVTRVTYIPSFGLALLLAMVILPSPNPPLAGRGDSTTSPPHLWGRVGWGVALACLLLAALSLHHGAEWVRAGETNRAMLRQLAVQYPRIEQPTTIFLCNAPIRQERALVASGLSVFQVYPGQPVIGIVPPQGTCVAPNPPPADRQVLMLDYDGSRFVPQN